MQQWLNHTGETQTILTTSLAQAATFLPPLLSFIPPPSLPDPNLKPWWPYGGHGRWWPSPCPTLGRYLLGSRQSRLLQLVVAVLGVGADGHPCKRDEREWASLWGHGVGHRRGLSPPGGVKLISAPGGAQGPPWDAPSLSLSPLLRGF